MVGEVEILLGNIERSIIIGSILDMSSIYITIYSI